MLNGAELLDEVLAALTGQVIDEPFEVLVIDSGSTDGSLEIVAAHPGVRLLQIDKSEFGHGRTRNLGVQSTTGDLIAFLTQDATPASEHWLASYREAATSSPVSDAMAKALKKRGFKFLGTTTLYAFMQSVGMINDHELSCFRYRQLKG